MLRETDDTALTGVAVVVDGQAESVSGRPPHTTFEVSVAAAGSIGDYILREGFGLDLHLHEAQPRSFRFGGSQPDRGHLLEALAYRTCGRPRLPAGLPSPLPGAIGPGTRFGGGVAHHGPRTGPGAPPPARERAARVPGAHRRTELRHEQ